MTQSPKLKFKLVSLLVLAAAELGCSKSSFSALKTAGDSARVPSVIWSKMSVTTNNVADGMTPAEITLTIRDEDNVALAGLSMNLQVTGSQNVIVPCTVTDTNGVSKCKVYSTWSEVKIFKILGMDNFSQDCFFKMAQISKSTMAIVSGGSYVRLNSGHRIVTTIGISENSTDLKDTGGVRRARSSIQATLLAED